MFMSVSVEVWRGQHKLGTGTLAGNGTSITGWSRAVANSVSGRRVTIAAVTVGSHAGHAFTTRVTADGATLDLAHLCPFAGA